MACTIDAVFTYGSPHTVDELSEADYKACSFGSPVSSDDRGNTTVTFDKAGTRYFACATGSHCSQGQKVAITVVGSNSTAGAPPPQGGRSPAPPPPPPKGNSAAPTSGGAEVAVKLVLGLAVGAMLAAF